MPVMKTPVNGTQRAITLFRDVDFSYASRLCLRVVHLIPVKHQNDVCIRLYFPEFSGPSSWGVYWVWIPRHGRAGSEQSAENRRILPGFLVPLRFPHSKVVTPRAAGFNQAEVIDHHQRRFRVFHPVVPRGCTYLINGQVCLVHHPDITPRHSSHAL